MRITFLANIFEEILDASDFMPRWVCGHWSQFHGWLYIISNFAIWLAYFTIPLLLLYFLSKRKGLVFRKVFIWFILFIFLCGTTHLVDAVIFWIPVYRLNALILFSTAVVSWITIYMLYKYIPIVLEFKSPDQLQDIIDEQTKELERAYQHLEESEKQFKTLVNHNPDIISRIGKDLRYKFINESILRMRNISMQDIVGKSMEEVGQKDEENNKKFIDHVKSVFTKGESINFEFSTNTKAINKGYFSLNIIPLKNDLGNIEDVLTVTRDITPQKLNEIELSESVSNLQLLADKLENKRKILEDFTYIVSHNLRSPVANLSALLQLIQEETNLEMRELLIQKVMIAFEVLSTTVEDLTSVVQIRRNSEVERQTLRFEHVLEQQMIAVENLIVDSGAEITFDFSTCETVEFPRIYLESIFLNLLTNSLKYRSADRPLKIKFTSLFDKLGIINLICEDNGLGIDLKKHGHKLFGLNKTFHNHPDGKGVGLFLIKNQIESMGGAIIADSEVDKGTKFIIIFNNYTSKWREK